jgi:hypothetical protein
MLIILYHNTEASDDVSTGGDRKSVIEFEQEQKGY